MTANLWRAVGWDDRPLQDSTLPTTVICATFAPPDRTIMGKGKPGVTPTKLGTFGGVFTPSNLSILGVIMFLRFGQVVGQNAEPDKAESKIQSLIETARVKATPNIVRSDDTYSEMRVRSASAAIVFIGFKVPVGGNEDPFM